MARSADFLAQVKRRRDAAVQFVTGKPAKDRQEALQFYRGDNLTLYGDSGDGLSTVVSRDTMEAIESMMPPLIRPFVAGEEAVSFEPIGAEDEDACQQASDYVNHCFRRGNNVLHVAQSALKDGLLFRLGVAKTVIEEVEEGAPEVFEGLTPEQLAAVDQARIAGDIAQDPETLLFSVTLSPRKVKRYRVHIIAPDEFLYEERLASIGDASFLGHRKQVRVSNLIAAGVPEELTRRLSPGEPASSEERDERYREEDSDEAEWKSDDPNRMVWVDELYILGDPEGIGAPGWRKVLLGGGNATVLNGQFGEPVEDHPYSTWTPIPLPHKLVGHSIADLTRDIQMQKTAIKREAMNALYLANRPMREVVDGQVNIDDLLNPTVGGTVRVKQVGMVREIPSGGQGVLQQSLAMVEALDAEREARTGVTRYNQGMDANSLNKTATGMNIIASNSQQRQELVARQFGEFLKDIFQKLLGLIVQNADEAEVERLTNKPFVPWPADYDMSVNVGLGTNNKDQLMGHYMALMGINEKLVQLQGGIEGPFLTAENIYALLKKVPEAMGLKGNYYSDPAEAQMQPQEQAPPPDPLAETRMEQETELQKEAMRQEGANQREAMKRQPEVVPFPVPMGL